METQINVLIIEDETLIAESLRLMLQNFGYNVVNVCYSYDTALRAIEAANYDLVISDINLGDGIDHRSGLDLMSHLRTRTHCPFIFLTAFGDQDTIQRAISLRPSAYLTKPINVANLYASVQLAVENFQQQQPGVPRLTRPLHPDYIYVKVGRQMLKVLWTEVYCLESVKNYVLLRSGAFNFDIPLRSSLTQVMDEMVPPQQRERFVRISRSIILDKQIITAVSEQEVQTPHGAFKYSGDFRKNLA